MSKSKISAPKENSSTGSKKRIVLSLNAEPGTEIFVAGTFNDWKPAQKPMIDKTGNGIYSCALMLAPGTYEYKFRVNDTWSVDPENPHFAQNDLGTLNSVLVVQ